MSDYIERGALMDKIEERLSYLRKENGDYDHYTDGYEECYCKVEDAPAAEVAPVATSEWEADGDYLLCTRCGVRVSRDLTFSDVGELNYCPNCGAKIGGGNDCEVDYA